MEFLQLTNLYGFRVELFTLLCKALTLAGVYNGVFAVHFVHPNALGTSQTRCYTQLGRLEKEEKFIKMSLAKSNVKKRGKI